MSKNGKFQGFSDIVETRKELRQITGSVFQPSVDKCIDHIDDIAAAYIREAAFIVVASRDGDHGVDVSPKGDPAGFVKVLDEKHIAIPDRPGNRRLDTFENLLRDPHLAILFLVPGVGETLRVYGEARIVGDKALLSSMAVNGRAPHLATVLHVERVMIHCPKCVIRSRLWSDSTDVKPDLPGIGAVMSNHAQLSGTADEQEQHAAESGMMDLY